MNKYIIFSTIILIIFIIIMILFYNNNNKNKETFYNLSSLQELEANLAEINNRIRIEVEKISKLDETSREYADNIVTKKNDLNNLKQLSNNIGGRIQTLSNLERDCRITPECTNNGTLIYKSSPLNASLTATCDDYLKNYVPKHKCLYNCAGKFTGCDYNTGKASYNIERIYYIPAFIDSKYEFRKPTYCSFTEADMISHYQYEARHTTNKDAKETISSTSLDYYNKNSNNIQQNIEINCPVDCIVAYNNCDYSIGKQSIRYMASPINGGNPCPNTEPKNCNDCEGEWSACDSNNMQTYTITKTKQGENTRDCLFKDKEQRVCTDIPEPPEDATIGEPT